MEQDPIAMQQAARQFAGQSVQLADLVTQVRRDIDNLSSMWKGTDAAAFAGLMTQWHTDVSGIQQVLEDVAKKVGNAGTGYEDLQRQIQQGFQN